MSEAQTFTIKKFRRNGNHTVKTGTLPELTKYFSYTLETGNSYNSKISMKPRTAENLVKALNKSLDYIQRGSYNPEWFEIID